ncbi:ABC transporter substrate-binding protein [Nocardiaceae bacterium YC2-7]|uniref:ABC transporter substrate-binding protein n=2 Tax=Antrihabitans stalactiti TaxID=2584121 RepID=A0A848KM51_9NOCA|nr:ABC transporter substrate-binding protein [Antrihabitans stalactiti]
MAATPLRWLTTAALALALVGTAACGNSDPLSSGGSCDSKDPNKIAVGSADFPESSTIAFIYAEALRNNGFDVVVKPNIGSREAYVPAVEDCSIDLIPDYTGNLLRYLNKDATATSSADVDKALTEALGDSLAISTPAPAEDKDAVVVTKDTADRWKLTSIADLASHSAEVKFGAPGEFQKRPVGLPGLKANYGLDILPDNFVPIEGGGPATANELNSGAITAANIFTTSPAIKKYNFVVLADPKNNFPAQNVVPLFRADKRSDKLVKVLDAVSAKLTTDDLIALNDSVSGDAKVETSAAAQQWVADHGLKTPVG